MIRLGAGVADLDRASSASAGSRSPRNWPSASVRAGFPRRRRRPPGHTARRHRHEHGDRRRIRPGLEAGVGAQCLGGTGAADSYEVERRPVAEHNLARSADPRGSRRRVDEELAADLGGRIPHVWLPVSRTSTLDLLGPGLTVFTGPRSARIAEAATAAAGPQPVATHAVHGMSARALGILNGGALVVRPDGVPATPGPALLDGAHTTYERPGPASRVNPDLAA